MGFCGYKYKFSLYAAHSNLTNSDENTHFHNFTITLYINDSNCKLDDNYSIEREVEGWFQSLQGKQLGQTELFVGRETTVEGMGNTFFDPLYDFIEKLGYELVKLEIYENPIRVFSVSKKRLDSIVNEIDSDLHEFLQIINLNDNMISSTKQDELLMGVVEEPNIEVLATIEPIKDVSGKLNSYRTQNSEIIHKTNKFYQIGKLLIGFACFLALAVITMYIVKQSGRYPQGSDTFCHLYRADLILKNIIRGNWFPLYDNTWYNGVEIMRYWGPIPLYLIASLEGILHSGILDAYVLFLGVLILIGGCGWLLWGVTYNRIALSILIGLIWFYLPENMRVVIYEGNLPRGVINALLPYYFYFLWRVMVDNRRKSLFPLMFVTTLITLCHLGITLMLIATATIFTLVYAKINHSLKNSLCALGASISGVMLAGIWVVPALIGGAASSSSTNQVMKNFFENAAVSLNPFTRLHGDTLSFYFGFSVLLICIFGIIFGSRNVKPGFITAMILFLCTTKSMYTLFSELPFSQFLWMIRFIPIGLAAAMASFLMWRHLRKWMLLLFCIMLIADCATSFQSIYFPKADRIQDVQASLDSKADSILLTKAKEITHQRMALMDLSKYGSFAPYYTAGFGKIVKGTFGAGWEGASTASNIVKLNASVENGWYVYLFDRALELGNDTVLIPINNLKEESRDISKVIASAKLSGYYLIENDGNSLLFHKDTVKQFGIITKYENIAIGDSASGIAMIYPTFEEGSNNNINDYTFDELRSYHTIYLSGFIYDDKEMAEQLLLKLAKSGVHIYIDMNRIPVEKSKKHMEIFGVDTQNITFTNSLPDIKYHTKTYQSLDFSADNTVWNTVYLEGLDHIEDSCKLSDKNLPYIGTSKNKNLHFIGFNLVYYLQTTRDLEIKKLVDKIFGKDGNSIPNRRVVPIKIQTYRDKIKINSDYDKVNTTLSSIDIFHSAEGVQTINHLIVVNSGSTIIDIKYPHITKGILVTILGIILVLLMQSVMRKKNKI